MRNSKDRSFLLFQNDASFDYSLVQGLWCRSFLGVLVSAWLSYSCEHVVLDKIHERMCHGGSVVVETFSCEFSVHIL